VVDNVAPAGRAASACAWTRPCATTWCCQHRHGRRDRRRRPFVDTGAAYLYGNVFNNNLGGPGGGDGALGIRAGSVVTMSANRFENNAGALSGSGDGSAIWLDSGAALWSTGDVLTGNGRAQRSGAAAGCLRAARLWLASCTPPQPRARRRRCAGGLTGTLVVARNNRWYANAAEGRPVRRRPAALLINTLRQYRRGRRGHRRELGLHADEQHHPGHVTGARRRDGALVTSDYNLYYVTLDVGPVCAAATIAGSTAADRSGRRPSAGLPGGRRRHARRRAGAFEGGPPGPGRQRSLR
jgi:hypothetical protein